MIVMAEVVHASMAFAEANPWIEQMSHALQNHLSTDPTSQIPRQSIESNCLPESRHNGILASHTRVKGRPWDLFAVSGINTSGVLIATALPTAGGF
jgi:hypothetical protein